MSNLNPRTQNLSPVLPTKADFALTGDRPTGRLHLGHYAGSILNRLQFQDLCQQTILVADLQALTDNARRPQHVSENVREVVLDYLACGIDPSKTTICLQSDIPELAELTVLFLSLVPIGHLERNPTVRSEMEVLGKSATSAGFLTYPVSQAADVIGFDATIVPVGEDQLPILDVADYLIGTINRFKDGTLKPIRPYLSRMPRLPGIDGKHKASKSLGNCINLSDPQDVVKEKVMAMYTDPGHIRVSDPGQVEGNVVFAHLRAFDPDQAEVMRLEDHYRAGGLGDVVVKRRLIDVLDSILSPIRSRRSELENDLGYIDSVLHQGRIASRERVSSVLRRVRDVFDLRAC